MKYLFILIIRIVSKIDYIFRKFVELFLPFKYYRTGKCRQCGECCKNILIYMDKKFLRIRWLRNLAIWWNKYFNGLRLIGCLINDGYMVFSCNYQNTDGSCGWYGWRAQFCREYPRNFKYFEIPTILKGCGYKFVKK